jgi:hypothetical protein
MLQDCKTIKQQLIDLILILIILILIETVRGREGHTSMIEKRIEYKIYTCHQIQNRISA